MVVSINAAIPLEWPMQFLEQRNPCSLDYKMNVLAF